MRIIVHGIGAIGGTIAAALALTGREVVGIARGAQLDAIVDRGLRLRRPDGDRVARFTCVGSPSGIQFRSDDAIVLATKTQDTAAALEQLAAAGVTDQPVFCAQNGVENERLALRRFPNVHGITVMLPADFIVPGEVAAFGMPRHGIFDIGRCPSGSDAADAALAEALTAAGIESFVRDDVMAGKYGKLLMNLGNIVEAAIGGGAGPAPIRDAARREGEAVLAAAGIPWRDVGASDPRRDQLMKIAPIDGVERTGSSSRQSLARGVGSIETSYLNGEIVLLGRLQGVPTPVNAWLTDLGARLASEGVPPGSVPLATALSELRLDAR
jgi:2-dehydropantoate 2-reductase